MSDKTKKIIPDFSRFAFKDSSLLHTIENEFNHKSNEIKSNSIMSETYYKQSDLIIQDNSNLIVKFNRKTKIDIIDLRENKNDDKKLKLLDNRSCENNSKTMKSNNDPNINATQLIKGGLFELYKGKSDLVELPLKLLIVGHNPSNQSWIQGHYYANPNNRMWSLLSKASIIPKHYKASNDQKCPYHHGIGFTDVLTGMVETNSCIITDQTMKSNIKPFYERLYQHLQRVSIDNNIPIDSVYPKVIAFAGVRQWKSLFKDNSCLIKNKTKITKKSDMISQLHQNNNIEECITKEGHEEHEIRSNTLIKYGIQHHRPEEWPLFLKDSIIFILPSSSGAAAMTNHEREGPYLELGLLLKQWYWEPGIGIISIPH